MTLPIIAEIGIQRRAKKSNRVGTWVGIGQAGGRSAWAENTWASGSTAGVARNFLSLVNTGLDIRLVLPEGKKTHRSGPFAHCRFLRQSHGFGHEVETDGEVVVNEVVTEVVKEPDPYFTSNSARLSSLFHSEGTGGVGHLRIKRDAFGDSANGELAGHRVRGVAGSVFQWRHAA